MKLSLQSRREFLEFLGRSAAAASIATLSGGALLSACASQPKQTNEMDLTQLPFTPLKPLSVDALVLATGFGYSIIAKHGDNINGTQKFGMNNDYNAFFPLNKDATDGVLWVNHEDLNTVLIPGYTKTNRTKAAVAREQLEVGGSLIRIKQDKKTKQWKMVKSDRHNRRIHGATQIPFVSERPILGKTSAKGTLANCAGGVTPWGTVLTCEENYHNFYGEVTYKADGTRDRVASTLHGWESADDQPPEHYGWVVEINPFTGKAKKLVAMGRFARECATVVKTPSGKCVVYSGDDAANQCVYKFISDRPDSLETGKLYVADTKNGKWISLSIEEQPLLKEKFKDQTDVLIRAREAAHLLGATPLGRPEDVEIDPHTGDVLVALTAHEVKGVPMGQILKISENNRDHLSMIFKASTFLMGGKENGFVWPDNMAFDPAGNLWFTSDIAYYQAVKPEYKAFGNNGLFFVPMSGKNAGKAFQVASSPNDAEFTGPSFSPDGKTLFLSVQHPGEASKSLKELTSHWPGGGSTLPRSCVVAIQGPALDTIVQKTT